MLTYTTRTRCHLCGCHIRGFIMYTARVNRRSIRTRGMGFGGMDRTCPECSTPTQWDGVATRYWLDPKSAAAVAEYRARRWA